MGSSKRNPYPKKPATEDDIISILGPLDDTLIRAILQTEATRQEIARAFEWLEENHYTMAVLERPMGERIRQVYDILDYASDGLPKMHPGH